MTKKHNWTGVCLPSDVESLENFDLNNWNKLFPINTPVSDKFLHLAAMAGLVKDLGMGIAVDEDVPVGTFCCAGIHSVQGKKLLGLMTCSESYKALFEQVGKAFKTPPGRETDEMLKREFGVDYRQYQRNIMFTEAGYQAVKDKPVTEPSDN